MVPNVSETLRATEAIKASLCRLLADIDNARTRIARCTALPKTQREQLHKLVADAQDLVDDAHHEIERLTAERAA